MKSWGEVLDEFEARLDAQHEALAAGDAGRLTPFVPPDVSAPLPAALASRAVSLVRRCRALEDAVAAALTETEAALLRAANTATTPTRRDPVYFDSRV